MKTKMASNRRFVNVSKEEIKKMKTKTTSNRGFTNVSSSETKTTSNRRFTNVVKRLLEVVLVLFSLFPLWKHLQNVYWKPFTFSFLSFISSYGNEKQDGFQGTFYKNVQNMY